MKGKLFLARLLAGRSPDGLQTVSKEAFEFLFHLMRVRGGEKI